MQAHTICLRCHQKCHLDPTEVLIDLLTGDLPLGFSNLRLQSAGHSGWVSRAHG